VIDDKIASQLTVHESTQQMVSENEFRNFNIAKAVGAGLSELERAQQRERERARLFLLTKACVEGWYDSHFTDSEAFQSACFGVV
jgi:hypothetical protein